MPNQPEMNQVEWIYLIVVIIIINIIIIFFWLNLYFVKEWGKRREEGTEEGTEGVMYDSVGVHNNDEAIGIIFGVALIADAVKDNQTVGTWATLPFISCRFFLSGHYSLFSASYSSLSHVFLGPSLLHCRTESKVTAARLPS